MRVACLTAKSKRFLLDGSIYGMEQNDESTEVDGWSTGPEHLRRLAHCEFPLGGRSFCTLYGGSNGFETCSYTGTHAHINTPKSACENQ